MGYLTQRLANMFPLWSNLRMDPSSFGHRFLDAYADFFEVRESDILRLAHLNEVIGGSQTVFDMPYLSYIMLEDVEMSLLPKGLAGKVSFPTVTYEDSGEDKVIVRASSVNEFYFSSPDYLEMKKTDVLPALKIWSSDSAEAASLPLNDNGEIPTGKHDGVSFQIPGEEAKHLLRSYHLGISVVDSIIYLRFADLTTDEPFLGHHKVILHGEDELGDEIREEILITDDGFYTTKKRFSCLKKQRNGAKGEKPAVQTDGFDGKVTIQVTDICSETKMCPFFMAITSDSSNSFIDESSDAGQVAFPEYDFIKKIKLNQNGFEGPLYLELSEESNTTGSYLDSYFSLFSSGQTYRRPENALEDEEDFRELLCSQYLLDDLGAPFRAVDMAFNWWDCKCYILDELGRVHIYSLGPTSFTPWILPRNKGITMEIKPLARRAVYGEEMPMWTWHRILKHPIKWVTIMRENPVAIAETGLALGMGLPDEPQFRGEYLQADLTWATTKYHHLGTPTDNLAEESWTDKKFWTDFPVQLNENVYDTLGQWNFYLEAALSTNMELELERLEKLHDLNGVDDQTYWRMKEEILKRDEEPLILRSSTAIMCEYLQAEKTYGTEEEPLIAAPKGIYIEGLENLICVVGEENSSYRINKYKPISHKWMPDPFSDLVLLREDYEEVKVTQDLVTVSVTPEY